MSPERAVRRAGSRGCLRVLCHRGRASLPSGHPARHGLEALRLEPGSRFRFSGARPGGDRVEWSAEVLEVDSPTRIELAYAGGEYIGRTAWELAGVGDETLVTYVYRGVRPISPRAEEHFARWGTRLHSVAMQEDALAGLARFLGGPGAELDDRVA